MNKERNPSNLLHWSEMRESIYLTQQKDTKIFCALFLVFIEVLIVNTIFIVLVAYIDF